MKKYDRNVPYNNLPLLPPQDIKTITIPVLTALNKANKALAELKGMAKKLPNQSMLVNTIILREAKASTEIENIFTTNDELYQSLTIREEELKGGAKEVLHYREALWVGYNIIQEKKEISSDLLIRLYQIIKQVNDGIRPAQTETVIKKRGSGLLTSAVVYTPPRGEKILLEKLNNLINYVNDDIKYDYDPLIKIAVSHYQFEAIHPFRDGNGRTGRLFSILLMIQKKLLDVPILNLSAYIIREKEEYYYLLNSVTSRKNWEEWIVFILKAIEETSLFTIQKITEIDHLFNQTYQLIQSHHPKMRKEIVEKIFEQPYISPQTLISKNIKSLNTVKKYLEQLTEIGILTKKQIGKETRYLNIDLFNLLSET